MAHGPSSRIRAGLALVAVTGAAASALVIAPSAQSATVTKTLAVPAGATLAVTSLGGGHGHGLSQFGAYGQAVKGRSYSQILASYYAGTKLATAASGMIRVRLSGAGSTLTVQPASTMSVTGVSGYLPTTGVLRYRLVAGSTNGLVLQRQTRSGGAYATVRSGLANGAQFARKGGAAIRLYHTNGTTTTYMGAVRAVRAASTGASAGVYPVNVVGTEWYAAGVVPREMPASWSRAALDAQAVAARTYALFEKAQNARQPYDICDSSSCQVYGGHQIYDTHGTLVATDLTTAATDTAHKVLTYGGKIIFAQYSASNGGWSTDGGQPYLKAAADTYDPSAPGNWYTDVRSTVTAKTVAAALGMTTVTSLTVTRDGHGTWGGRVVSVTAKGTKSGKAYTRTGISGTTFADALGVYGTTWVNATVTK